MQRPSDLIRDLTVLHFVIVFQKIVLVFLFTKLIALCNQRIHFQSNREFPKVCVNLHTDVR